MYLHVGFNFLLASVCLVYANTVPFEVNKCKSTDSKCLRANTIEIIPKFVMGLPTLNIKPLDPMELDMVDASSPNLKLLLTNLKVIGLKDCIPKKVENGKQKVVFIITLQCNVEAIGNYDMKGRILVVPLEGNDKFSVKLNKAIFKVECDYYVITKEGKQYWNVTTWDFAYKLQDKSSIKFDNLFNGNKQLAQAANEVIDSNSNAVVDEIGVPVIKTIVARIMESIKQFFISIPLEDLSLDEIV